MFGLIVCWFVCHCQLHYKITYVYGQREVRESSLEFLFYFAVASKFIHGCITLILIFLEPSPHF